MARRMIPVRNKTTGQTALVSERAYPLFSDSHERLDIPQDATPDAPAAQDAPPPAPQAPTPKSSPRRAAATSETE